MKIDKEERYSINRVLLCTFDKSSEKLIKINSEYYPMRWCVIDKECNKAIDIKMGLQYDYIPTISGLHLVSRAAELIQENKRAAIHPIVTLNYEDGILEQGKEIIEALKWGFVFPDGNEMLNETEYFEELELEKAVEENKKPKTLKKKRF